MTVLSCVGSSAVFLMQVIGVTSGFDLLMLAYSLKCVIDFPWPVYNHFLKPSVAFSFVFGFLLVMGVGGETGSIREGGRRRRRDSGDRSVVSRVLVAVISCGEEAASSSSSTLKTDFIDCLQAKCVPSVAYRR